jgi:acyl-CoA dehydrogenase
MKNYFFNPADLPEVGQRSDAANDDFLFDQGPTRGLGSIQFHDYAPVFERFDLPNVKVFAEQAEVFKAMLAAQPPTEAQSKNTDWLLAVGEIFTLIVYAQLVLENAEIYGIDQDLVAEIFDVTVRDFSAFAVELFGKAATTPGQSDYCTAMIRKPVRDDDRYRRVWEDHVYAQRDAYTMAE